MILARAAFCNFDMTLTGIPGFGSPTTQPFVQPTPQAAPTAGGSPTPTPVTPTLGAEQLQQLMLQMLNNQCSVDTFDQMLRRGRSKKESR